jgi:hypothetical protein
MSDMPTSTMSASGSDRIEARLLGLNLLNMKKTIERITTGIPQVKIIVVRYLHQLFLPSAALSKKVILDIIILPQFLIFVEKII